MANRYAVASGDWSDTSTWDGGTLPANGDTVRPNGFIVNIDIDTPTGLTLINNASSPAVAGGYFILEPGVTINADLNYSYSTNSYASPLVLFSAIGGTSFINGEVLYSSSATNNRCLEVTGTGHLEINGPVRSSANSNGSRALHVSASATIVINGNVTGNTNSYGIRIAGGSPLVTITGNATTTGTGNGIIVNGSGSPVINIIGNSITAGTGHAMLISSGSPTVNITGDVGGSHINQSYGISNASSSAVINITGNLTEYAIFTSANCAISVVGTSTAGNVAAITSSVSPTVSVTGIVTASVSAPCINLQGSSGKVTFSGQLEQLGEYSAITAYKVLMADSGTSSWQFKTPTSADRTMYTPGVPLGLPAESDVKDGVVYGPSNEFTGTLVVNPPLTPDSLFDEIENSSHPVAVRLRNVSTVQSTGDQLAAYNT